MPRAYLLQCLATLLLLATGLLSLAVAVRGRHENEYHRAAWQLTGITFVVFCVDRIAANVWQAAALRAGNPSPVLSSYLRWMPVFNHSRTFLMLGAAVALALLSFWKAQPDRRFWMAAMKALGVGLLAGVAVGMLEGPFDIPVHFTAVALWDVVELVTVLPMLFIALVTNRMDRYLWATYGMYACSIALAIFWFSLLTQLGIARAWHPPAWSVHAMRDVFYSLMLASAAARLWAGTRGRTVQGMLGRPMPAQLSTLH
jgi:hypothetical protein